MPESRKPANRQRRDAGPWVVVEVPMKDRSLLYPSRRRFYSKESEDNNGSTEYIDKAERFTVQAKAKHQANRIMHLSRGTWAEVVPFSIAWALIHSGGAPWRPREAPDAR